MPDYIHNPRMVTNHPWNNTILRAQITKCLGCGCGLCPGPTPFLLVGLVQSFSLNWDERATKVSALPCATILSCYRTKKKELTGSKSQNLCFILLAFQFCTLSSPSCLEFRITTHHHKGQDYSLHSCSHPSEVYF